jgi:pimeloyl-ACP methyl ester carboxylesterase
VFDQIAGAGIPPERTMILGFSQGACLMLEYAARHALRYGGIVGLTGGLIGPDDTPRDYAGSLAGTPVFLGCSDVDIHVPKTRVDLTATVLRRLGGVVTERIYPNLEHTVNQDEIAFVRAMMTTIGPTPSPCVSMRRGSMFAKLAGAVQLGEDLGGDAKSGVRCRHTAEIAAWSSTSLISSCVTPLLTAARTCRRNSSPRFNATSIATVMRLRV